MLQAQEPASADKSMRTLSAASTEELSCEFGSAKYFALCSLGGVLSCGITHTAVTPLDLVKCRLQVKNKYVPAYFGWIITRNHLIAEMGIITRPLKSCPGNFKIFE